MSDREDALPPSSSTERPSGDAALDPRWQQRPADPEAGRTLLSVVYGLYAFSFLFMITAVVGVIILHIKRDAYYGSWLDSHFSWLIRTFWWGLFWLAISLPLMLVIFGHFLWLLVSVWLIYRVVKGWIYLYDRRPVGRL